MARGTHASKAIPQGTRLFRFHKPKKPTRSIACFDLMSNASRFWNHSTQDVANQVYSGVRELQEFFPRVVGGMDGGTKVAKELRVNGKTVKKQYRTDGVFTVINRTSEYQGIQLAVRSLIEEKRNVPELDGLTDFEAVCTGGDGEDGCWLAAQAELSREGTVRGKFSELKRAGASGPASKIAPFIPLDPDEEPLEPAAARAFAKSYEEAHSQPDVEYVDVYLDDDDEDDTGLIKVFEFMLDGEALNGEAEEYGQRWWFEGTGSDKVMIVECVEVKVAIRAMGEGVEKETGDWIPAQQLLARQRLDDHVQPRFPLFDSVLLAYDATLTTAQIREAVAAGVEALTTDYGGTEADGVGPVMLAKLGVLAQGVACLWQQLAAERTQTWADPAVFHLSLFRAFCHPGGSDPSLILSETLDQNGDSTLPNTIWVSPRPHAHHGIYSVLEAIKSPLRDRIDLSKPYDDETQAELWRVLMAEVKGGPVDGWVVLADPLPPAQYPHDKPEVPTARPAGNSVAGSGTPGTPRIFPILASNFDASKHWDVLGTTEELRDSIGELKRVAHPPGWKSAAEERERELVEREEREAAEEAEAQWEEERQKDEDEGRFYLLTDVAVQNHAEAMERWGQGKRRERAAKWTNLIDAFLILLNKHNPNLSTNQSFSFRFLDFRTDELLSPAGEVIGSIYFIVDPREATTTLQSLSPAHQQLLLPNGSLSLSGLTSLFQPDGTNSRTDRILVPIRTIFKAVCHCLGVRILSELGERVEEIIRTGFQLIRKPSMLRKILEMPSFFIRDPVYRVLEKGTWYGTRYGNLDMDPLSHLADALQLFFTKNRNTQKQKNHFAAALHALGYCSIDDFFETLVPHPDLAARAFKYFSGLQDREWISYRDLGNTISWGRRASLEEVTRWACRCALGAAAPPGTDLDAIDAKEQEALLGGKAVFVEDPRPLYRLSKNRARWKATGSPAGDLLEEELAAEAAAAQVAYARTVDEIRHALQTRPDRSFIGSDELSNWAGRIDPTATAKGADRSVQGLFNVLKAALLEAAGIDGADET
ncbi:hypothetical protein JCM11641_006921 [Rhodosporidiobolus odoratus]